MIDIKITEYFEVHGNIPDILKKELNFKADNLAMLSAANAYVLNNYMKVFNDYNISEIDFNNIEKAARHYTKFNVKEILDDNRLVIEVGVIQAYKDLLNLIEAKHSRLNIYYVPKTKIYQTFYILGKWSHPFLPKPIWNPDVKQYLLEKFNLPENQLKALSDMNINKLRSIENAFNLNLDSAKDKLKIDNVLDIIWNKPNRYENFYNISNPIDSEKRTVINFVGKIGSINFNYSTMKKCIFDIVLPTGEILNCVGYGPLLYNLGEYQKKQNDLIFTGMKNYGKNFTINKITPYIYTKIYPLVPIYKASPINKFKSELVHQSIIETIVRYNGKGIFDYLNLNKDSLWKSLIKLHCPQTPLDHIQALNNLGFYELLALQIYLKNRKQETNIGLPINASHKVNGFYDQMVNKLPFKLSDSQENAIKEISSYLRNSSPQEILLSGDVGSGKTVTSLFAALYMIDNSYQVAMMAPTDILAKQLYNSCSAFLEKLENPPKTIFVSGKLTAKEQKEIKQKVENGEYDLIIGTHSILNMKFKKLGFVIIDEEQRFGSIQRESWQLHRERDTLIPHTMVQTATPIPRTISKALMGDINLVSLKGGRKRKAEFITDVILGDIEDLVKNKTDNLWITISDEIKAGRQVFFVCPQVTDTEDKDVATVEKTVKTLEKYFKWKIKGISGKDSQTKQTKTMEEFKNHEFDVLVGSSILEVGIDIGNATTMVILSADRFGLSALHQIRGRVGRNDYNAYCFLISNSNNETSIARLEALKNNTDGFELALIDLKNRNNGSIFGTNQTGNSGLVFLDSVDYSEFLDQASHEAEKLLNSSLAAQAIEDSKILLKTRRSELV